MNLVIEGLDKAVIDALVERELTIRDLRDRVAKAEQRNAELLSDARFYLHPEVKESTWEQFKNKVLESRHRDR